MWIILVNNISMFSASNDAQIVNTTPRKINVEPENTPLEEENHLRTHHFQVLC